MNEKLSMNLHVAAQGCVGLKNTEVSLFFLFLAHH